MDKPLNRMKITLPLVMANLIAGTILAIVAVPALASFALEKHAAGHEPWLVRWLNRIYFLLHGLF